MQTRAKGGLPGVTLIARLVVTSSERAIAEAVTVKGPIVIAGEGNSMSTPLEGIGVGIGTL